MAQDEEQLTERNSNINTISELPSRPFSLTMELPIFLTTLSLSLSGTAISNILLYRTCVQSLHHDIDTCKVFLEPERNNGTRDLEEEVQKYAAFVQSVRTVIEALWPAILSLFLGGWSDTHGRKPLIVWPLFGIAIRAVLTVVYAMLDDFGPWWYLLTVIPFSLTGGFSVLFTGAYCYLSDVTSTANRSIRMTTLTALLSAGSVTGSLLSAYLLKAVGNVYLLLIVATVNVIAYAFANLRIRESLNGALQVLNILLVKDMFRECFKDRPNKLRTQMLLLVSSNTVTIFMLYGFLGLDYLYYREKLHWALKDYTTYSAVSTTISFAGSFLAVAVLQKILPISDLAFCLVAFVSASANYMIKALATTTWHMYLGSSVALFESVADPLVRSTLTKILPPEDIAKVFALMCATEAICPLTSPLIYNALYEYTISVFPGAICVLSSMLYIVCFVLISSVIFIRWRVSRATTTYDRLTVES